MTFQFKLLHRDATSSARRGVFFTPHGAVQTPAFMPVGTQGTVKGVTIDQVAGTGAEMILGNTYHLALRPGHQVVRRLGGLHAMSGWEGPILTDSGGFQVFSLEAINKVTEHSATFRSHPSHAQSSSWRESLAVCYSTGNATSPISPILGRWFDPTWKPSMKRR